MSESPPQIKITVLKRFAPEEVFDEKPIGHEIKGKCDYYTDGQEFNVDLYLNQPEGFCSQAWRDLYNVLYTVSMGGEFPWYTEKGAAVTCCTDGLRPVVFKIERT